MFSLFKKKTPEPPTIVVPRIKQTQFLNAVARLPGMDDRSTPITEPIVGDLLLTYAVDTGPNYEMVSRASLDKYKLQAGDLRNLAVVNALAVLRSVTRRTDGTLVELTAPEHMVACLILFPEFWDQVEDEEGGRVLVCVPHRDFVVFGRADNPDTRPALDELLATVDFDETHALSRLIYTRAPDGSWQTVA